jgi:hypothetical protein
MFIHPHCACSRASVGELASLMARARGRLHARVLFVRPYGLAESWAKTDVWYSASSLPDVATIVDDGREARLFDAATSGQTLVYDGAGRLLFAGGITAARGHWGDNGGLSTIRALLERTPREPATTPVYGCPIFHTRPLRANSGAMCAR